MPPRDVSVRSFEEVCRAYPAFRSLSHGSSAQVRRGLQPFDAARGHPIASFRPGRVPFVLGGHVQVLLPLASGRHVPLYTLERGGWCVLALAQAVGQPPRTFQAVALDAAHGVTLAADDVRHCLHAHHELWVSAFDVVAARVLDLTDTLAQRSASTVDQRLAALLVARGPSIDTTHQGLADALGTAREVVSRALEHFAAEGLVRLRRAHIDVADSRRLAAYQQTEVD